MTPVAEKKPLRLPSWLKRPLSNSRVFVETLSLVGSLQLTTVCQGAKCPNMHECFSRGTATFLVLGRICTRNCSFCNIALGKPDPVDPDEPGRLARAAALLRLDHVVLTSVTRDDLPDGGAAHFATSIRAMRKTLPASSVEVLIPDFQGSGAALDMVIDAGSTIINHNVETHPSLYSRVRPQADYNRSLTLLSRVKHRGIAVKSGFMVGLGERDLHVRELLTDLGSAGCDMVTIGQYMQPSKAHPLVARYVPPEMFEEYAHWGREQGIAHVFSAPLVRSSYQAGATLKTVREKGRILTIDKGPV